MKPTVRSPVLIGTLGFLILLVDGFDTASIAFAAPSIVAEWKVSPASITPAFLMTSIGAVAGYLVSGRLVRSIGARTTIIASVVTFGVLSLATTAVASITALSALRFLTALGLGAAIPPTIALATEHAGERRRAFMTVAVSTGLSLGAGAGALAASSIIEHLGWRYVLVLGGIAPLVLAVGLFAFLPRGNASVMAPKSTIVGRRSGPPLSTASLLWAFSFLVFANMYFVLFWLPMLLSLRGFSASAAPLGSVAFGMGGVAGNLLLLLLLSRWKVQSALVTMAIVVCVCFAFLPQPGISWNLFMLLIGATGAGLATGCVGQATLAVLLYPPERRAAGIGYSAAVGRMGSIVGPAIGGALLAVHATPDDLLWAGLGLALLALMLLVAIGRSAGGL